MMEIEAPKDKVVQLDQDEFAYVDADKGRVTQYCAGSDDDKIPATENSYVLPYSGNLISTSKGMSSTRPGMKILDGTVVRSEDEEMEVSVLNSKTTEDSIVVESGAKPLLSRRLEHERCRKLLKEVWHREVKRMQEAVSSMRKAKTAYHQRLDEYQKSPLGSRHSRGTSSASASDVDPDFKSSDQRRKTKSEEDLLEAELNHKALVENANEQHTALLKTKAQVLQQIHELIIQCDQTMKTVTVNYFQLQHSVTAPSPIQFQTLCESSRLYEPGSQYLEFVKRLPGALNPEGVEGEPQKSFTPSWLETYLEDCPGPASEQEGNIQFSQLSRDRKSMDSQASSDGSLNPIPSDGKGARARAWTTTGHCSDTDSSLSTSSQSTGAGRSYNASPTALKAHGGSSRAEAACSEPLDSSGSFDSQVENGGGGGRGNSGEKQMFLGMSKAAETHRFKKLRTPSRCRECDSYVYFQGAECCECGLASHKKCLKTLALRCGHKRLPRKMTTFGVEIGHHMSETSVSIPPLIAKCVSEIDKRGLKVKASYYCEPDEGIYRVSGVKSRVEKLCQSFENGPELVDLTEVHPNIIANVLKLYLRQLPEPLLPAYLYNDFIRIAAEYPENDEEADSPRALRAINSMRDIAAKLPKVHRDTLSFLMHHLTRVAAEAPANNMPSSNLGIVFGPTLLRSGDGNPSLNTLIDTCFQTRAIEILIVHATYIFGRPPQLPKEYYGDSAVIPESSAKPHSIPRQDSGSDSGFLSRVPLMRSLSSLGTPPPNAGKTKTGEAPHPAASNSGRDAQNKEPLRSASKNFLHQHLALGSHHSEDLDEIAPDKSQPIVMLQAVEDSRKKTTGYSQSLSFESPSSQHLQPDHSHNPRKDALKKCLSDMTAIAGIEIEPPQPPPRLEKPSKSDSGPAVVGSKPFRKSLSGPTLSGESALVGLMRSQTSPSRRTRPQVPLAAMAEAVAGVDASPTDYQHKQPSKPGNKHSASGTGSGASVPSVSESDGSTGSLFSPRPSKIRTAMDFRPQLHKHAFEPESSPSRSSKASDK
ncbi:unnamed protein product [Notodromas monacha]|uniref:Uncharacterized protein n=1 Tax=Notodromas monacha TaxID=399045 RepID=A0A7R9BN55_9CRUS|nr:unnamed protein product [Notodromas monacha]CAG0918258.1 unnamed protein product [Notodromas monacha]